MSIRDEDRTPVHDRFGLTYGNYMVLHRSIMEAMPVGWQDRWVALVDEFWDEFDDHVVPQEFEVHVRGEKGRFLSDPFAPYRHPDRALIESARRRNRKDLP